MKKLLLFVVFIYIAGFSPQSITEISSSAQIIYNVDVTNHSDDLFHVTVFVNGLTEGNSIYNLPATVPGTYSNLNFGRFVKTFKAYDKNGNELSTEKISTNQWQIVDVDKLAKLVYDIEDTFDADVETVVMPMSGTGIEDDFILMNTFGVLGYFEGLQINPVRVKIDYNSDWAIGTALTLDDEGYYTAETYDHLADSPVLLGELTSASITVENIDVKAFVYSADTSIYAEKILDIADDVLQSAGEFIGYSPVTHYRFLFCFVDMKTFRRNNFMGAGALEHSYSSLFVLPVAGEANIEAQMQEARNFMAHEFMHILTPLNLHSNVIQPFNFVIPTASEHIWLYEGVTEWVSDIMLMRSGIITPDEYLAIISGKLRASERFSQDISLSRLSREVYSESIVMEFLNFYQRGAVTATLLDIRLLELSNGTRGLREVFLELLKKYGKNKPFPEEKFSDEIVAMTYPEIEQFINDYIKDSKPLPYVEYIEKLGYRYIAEKPSEDKRPTIGVGLTINENEELVIGSVREEAAKHGLQRGDVIVKMLGQEVNFETFRNIRGELLSMNVSDPCDLVVRRDGKEIELTTLLLKRITRHIFEEMDETTEEQKSLRNAWTRNL